jgi:hypothetical protein
VLTIFKQKSVPRVKANFPEMVSTTQHRNTRCPPKALETFGRPKNLTENVRFFAVFGVFGPVFGRFLRVV